VCITGTGFEGQDVTVHSVYAAFLKSIKALLQEGTGLGVRVKLDESNPVDDLVKNYVLIRTPSPVPSFSRASLCSILRYS
jgi:hypothetical protein